MATIEIFPHFTSATGTETTPKSSFWGWVPAFSGQSSWWEDRCVDVHDWLKNQGCAIQDAVWVLPQRSCLPTVRQAWARQIGGWLPNLTVVEDLCQITDLSPMQGSPGISFDHALDRWRATQWLKSLQWGRALARRDPRAFEGTVARLTRLAQGLAKVWLSLSDASRSAWLSQARDIVANSAQEQDLENNLIGVALEWAVLDDASWIRQPREQQASAWIWLVEGWKVHAEDQSLESEPLMLREWIKTFTPATPVLSLRVQKPVFEAIQPPKLCVCDSFESEAQETAAQVVAALSDPPQAQGSDASVPVALVAEDRLMIRRVRALLEAAQVSVRDETGWTLSTTRAAASVMGLLKLGQSRASADDLLNWLKSAPFDDRLAVQHDAARLESALRDIRWAKAVPPDEADRLRTRMGDAAWERWQSVLDAASALHWTGSLSLPLAMKRLHHALALTGIEAPLQRDDAGQQVLATLGSATSLLPEDDPALMSYQEFMAWVDAVLDEGMYLPHLSPNHQASSAPTQVIITPLSRTLWRPLRAVVWPGMDAKHVGAVPSAWPWLTDRAAMALGLMGREQRQQQESWEFMTLLMHHDVRLLRRHADGDAPLAPSPLLEKLSLQAIQHGQGQPAWLDLPTARQARDIPSTGTPHPLPRIHHVRSLWPKALSATAVESLRACPYQFFTKYVLSLRESDELDGEIQARDVGTWLHDVLKTFHDERVVGEAVDDAKGRLQDIAVQTLLKLGLDQQAFLPNAAWFETVVQAYIQWIDMHESAGWSYHEGESDQGRSPDQLMPWDLRLQGRLDRIDHHAAQGLMVIDYKAGKADKLKAQVAEPQEDTQLLFYAALMGQSSLKAAYLPLDTHPLQLIEHDAVAEQGQALVEQLSRDWQRMADGAPLPALGQGKACEYCKARGLCRRDHWTSVETPHEP